MIKTFMIVALSIGLLGSMIILFQVSNQVKHFKYMASKSQEELAILRIKFKEAQGQRKECIYCLVSEDRQGKINHFSGCPLK